MAKAKKALNWENIEDLVFALIDQHPQVDAKKLSLEDIQEVAENLPAFESGDTEPSEEVLTELQQVWSDERNEMEEDLGPVESNENSILDEDIYRADRMVSDEDEEETAEDDFDDINEDFEEEEER